MNHLLKKLIIPIAFISFTCAIFGQTFAMEETALEDSVQIVRQRTSALPSQLQEDIPEREQERQLSSPVISDTEPTPKLIDILLQRLELHLAKRRVLSLDGRGVRGAFTAQILARIEEATELPIKDIFQGSITGTSTGSFIALGLTFPDKKGQENTGPYSAAEIVDFYRTRAFSMFSGCCAFDSCVASLQCPPSHSGRFICSLKSIFSCFGCFGCCYNCGGACGPKYTRKALDTELETLLGSTRQLREALGPVQTTTYDIGRGGGVLHLSSTNPHTNQYRFNEAGAASSAAPTYFPAPIIGDGSTARPRRVCVDGGLIENNPILAAIEQAQAVIGDGSDIRDFTVVSVGTGQAAGAFSNEDLRYAGAFSWARPIIDIGMDGTSMATHLSFSSIFKGGNYYRMQASLSRELLDMDDPRNVEGLIKEADNFCRDVTSSFNVFLERLKIERQFKKNIATLYGKMSNDEFMAILARFRKLVGVTHEETKQNIERFISIGHSTSEDSRFATQVAHYFNDVKLLKALKIEMVTLLDRL